MKPSSIWLDFGPLASTKADPEQHLLNNISTVAQAGSHLWLASDEGHTIERLSWNGHSFAQAMSYDLSDYFAMPKGSAEIDIEALAIDRDQLWVAGSHSLVRQAPLRKANGKQGQRKFLTDLATIKRRPRRYLIGRLDLSARGGKVVSIANRAAPCLAFDRTGNSLTQALRSDPHLSSFLNLPDKENGLDIEGLAARDDRLYLGLRGPVIGGYAVILQIEVEVDRHRLTLADIGAGGRRYRKFFLDLGGLGVRDLTTDGDDLVVIAGPTMAPTSPWAAWRWRKAFNARREGLVDANALRPLPGMAFEGPERPEGITRFQHPDGGRGWLVVYDQPVPTRISKNGRYRADFFH